MTSAAVALPGASAPFVALGLLSAGANQPRRDKIRQTTSKFANYEKSVAVRFVLASPPDGAPTTSTSASAEQRANRDLVVINVSDTPFRCGLKYVIWFDHARREFPSARYLAAGDDDAYIQLAHFEADLRNVAAQIGDVAPTLWGMIQWRSHYDNVTHDTSTGFMGWGCADGQAANVRRGMNACRAELAARPGLRAQWLRRFGSAPLSKSSKSSEPVTPQLQASTPACAALAANEKRLYAVLAKQVDWELPPFPLPNGPLFAVSRSLGGLLSDDLDTPLVGSRAWVESLERTPLASRYWKSKEAGGRAIPEMAKRRCWPNSDSSLGLFVARATIRAGVNVTMVNTPLGVQHFPMPVYSAARSYSNRSIVAHGAKRPLSRMWGIAESRMSGAFIPYNRTCGACADAMGWVTYEPSAFASWQCCGRVIPARAQRRSSSRTRHRKGGTYSSSRKF